MAMPIAVALSEASQIGEARRVASALASHLGFDETARSRVALVVTEAATNVIRHGGGGQVIVRPLSRGAIGGLEILALDRGPGIADVSAVLADGYSTTGTAGAGLGAIRRLSTVFDLYSTPGAGTAVLARLWASPLDRRLPEPTVDLDLGAVCLPKTGEIACGDAWAATEDGRVLVADGLGHGPMAAAAALAAVQVFCDHPKLGPADTIWAAHKALRDTRGAVLSVAQIDRAAGVVRYAGIGNIAASVLHNGTSHGLISHNGTVGLEVRKVQEVTAPWHPATRLVLMSDGLSPQWQLARYPGLMGCDPGLIAGVLFRDQHRGRDDATVVVAREIQAPDRT